jgi:hypothetical protein
MTSVLASDTNRFVRWLLRYFSLGALVVLPSAFGVSAANATVLPCGATVTTSVKVTNSLFGCPGNGLQVGASNITIDLDGNTLNGAGAAGTVGIDTNGHSHVTIRNARVSGFETGIYVFFGEGDMIRNTIVSGNASSGIFTLAPSRTTIEASTAEGNVCGIVLDGGSTTTVAHVVATKNGLAGDNCNGITAYATSGTVLRYDQTNDNGFGGVNLFGGTHTLLRGDVANENKVEGVVVQPDGGETASGTTISETTANLNAFAGINLIGPSHSRLSNNVASHNVGYGVLVQGGSYATIVGQLSTHNAGGIFVSSTAAFTSIFGGEANANAGEGIYVEGLPTKLTNTVTNLNGGNGIFAVPGVTAKGAKAEENLTAPQCVNVSCS